MQLKKKKLASIATAIGIVIGGVTYVANPFSSNNKNLGNGIQGYFSVDLNGAAQYSIPIDVPPGTNGMEPKLSLQYSSQIGNGILGVGFELSGLSVIERSGATVAQDGFRGGINYNEDDRFVLDGQRLMNINSSPTHYSNDSAEYRTEQDSWSKIVSFGGSCGQDPCSFLVTLKNGTKMEYGNSLDSRIEAQGPNFNSDSMQGSVRTWLLNKMTDLNGNQLQIQYTLTPQDSSNNIVSNDAASGQYYPNLISYTSNDSLEAQRFVRFYYEGRADTVTNYEGGAKVRTKARLHLITTSILDTEGDTITVKSFQLNYESSPVTGFSRITSVVEITNEGNYLSPTLFSWADGASQFTNDNSNAGFGLYQDNANAYLADFNGDGITDLLSEEIDSVYYGGNGTINNGVSTGMIPQDNILTGDFNGDGLDDVFSLGDLNSGTVYLSSATQVNSKSVYVQNLQTNCVSGSDGPCVMVADFNGDGITDLFSQNGYDGYINLFNNNGNLDTVITFPIPPANNNIIADFNGDGQADILNGSTSGTNNLYLSDISKTNSFNQPLSIPDFNIVTECVTSCSYAGDYNGDGKADIFSFNGNDYSIYYSNGAGFDVAVPITNVPGSLISFWPGDYNGDGNMDLYTTGNSSSDTLYISNGAGFNKVPLNQSLPGNTVINGDFNGDGAADLIFVEANQRTMYLASSDPTYSASNQKPDLLTAINNGIGSTIVVQYKPLTDGSVYSKSTVSTGTGIQDGLSSFNRFASAPLSTVQAPLQHIQDIQSSMYVVSGYTKSDGRGNIYPYSYNYSNAQVDLDRGWLGFASKVYSDSSQNTRTSIIYNQEFPFTSQVDSFIQQTLDKSQLMLKRFYTYSDNVTASYGSVSNAYQVLKSSTTEQHFTYGAFNYSLLTNYAYDAYGNVLNTAYLGDTDITPPLYTKTTYINDTTQWVLGITSSTQKSSNSSFSDTLLLEKRYYSLSSYNPDSIQSWDNQQNQWITTRNSYDTYGNVIQKVNTSYDTISYHFDNYYHTFLSSTISPTNERGFKLADSAVYDARFGALLQKYDNNGNVLIYELDDIGRTISITGPDITDPGETIVLSTFSWGLTADSGYYALNGSIQDWESETMQYTVQYYDGLTRSYCSKSYGVNDRDSSRINRVDYAFDSENRIVGQSLPYFDNPTGQDTVFWSSNTYDPYGRVIRKVLPKDFNDSTVTTITYNGYVTNTVVASGTVNASTTVANYAYVNSQYLIVSKTTQNSVTGNLTDVTTYQYDGIGRITAVADPAKITSNVTFSSYNRKIKSYDPSMGNTSAIYNDFNRTLQIKDNAGNNILKRFDALGRIISDVRGAADSVSYEYDDPSIPNSLGKRSKVIRYSGDQVIMHRYTYNEYGQQVTDSLFVNGIAYPTQYAINPLNQITTVTLPDSTVFYRTYDTYGNLQSVAVSEKAGVSAVNYAQYSNYNAQNLPGNVLYNNGTVSTYTYYPVGNVNSYKLTNANGDLLSQNYNWDYQYRIAAINDLDSSAYMQRFSYDYSGRLDSAFSFYATNSYKYDVSGNLIKKDSIQYQYNNFQVKGGSSISSGDGVVSYIYDQLGNRSSKSIDSNTIKYSYDALSQLDTLTVNDTAAITFVYDYDGRKIIQNDLSNAITTTFVCPYYEVNTFGGGTEFITKYVKGLFGQVSSLTYASKISEAGTTSNNNGVPSLDTLYFHQDYLGNTHIVTDLRGNRNSRIDYDPYGSIVGLQGENDYRYKFGEKEYNSVTDLYYYEARFYDPAIGRFLTADSYVGGEFYQPDVFNCYAYGLNNPVNNVDPSGHKSFSKIASFFVDAGEIFAGLLLEIVPGAENVAGAILDAGIGGLQYSITTSFGKNKSFSWSEWGQQEASGALIGLLSDGVGGIIDEMGGVESTGCFVKGTKVSGEKALLNIEDIKTGDLVWAFDDKTGKKELKKVNKTSVREVHKLIALEVGNKIIKATEEHPFWLKNKWVKASELKKGDTLITYDGKKEVIKGSVIANGSFTVYNLEVDSFHDYYITESKFLVHNGICSSRGAALEDDAAAAPVAAPVVRELDNFNPNEFDDNTGFSGVCDVGNGDIKLRPTSRNPGTNFTLDNGDIYPGRGHLARNGSHITLANSMGGTFNKVGFSIVKVDDNAFEVGWRSRSLNDMLYPGGLTDEQMNTVRANLVAKYGINIVN
ncbi:FG-GAP-like repeat-containing protein [Sporocytophaga myxococcoides]|uniref:FG-GAP-like repeat-containing protein n=1 Tax=Sporocytophaga myxococcoides TaxID=153721 RepID=UPI0004053A90|nr:FG-GAP-like repeat-containing protein [Sporocytophaga myxococcoides]